MPQFYQKIRNSGKNTGYNSQAMEAVLSSVMHHHLKSGFTSRSCHFVLGLCNIICLPIYCNILVSNTYCNTFFHIAIYCVLFLRTWTYEFHIFFFRNSLSLMKICFYSSCLSKFTLLKANTWPVGWKIFEYVKVPTANSFWSEEIGLF